MCPLSIMSSYTCLERLVRANIVAMGLFVSYKENEVLWIQP
jgi:hypothetical protein